jgi:hypothetical protein
MQTRPAVAAPRLALFAVLGAGLFLAPTRAAAQAGPEPRPGELPIALVSARVARFEAPLQIEAGTRGEPLKQAVLVTVAVDAAAYDAMPPGIEPFLYIGRQELRTFGIDRSRGKTLLVTFFTPADVAALDEDAPVVLTADHGAPARQPERFLRRLDVPRFRKGLMTER